MKVSDAVVARRSIRAFTDDPIEQEVVEALLTTAARSPSGGNLQPWKVIALANEAKEAASRAGLAAIASDPATVKTGGEDDEAPVYPRPLGEPYHGRRAKVAEDMYALLGIPRDDVAARLGWLASNYAFFGAPVGLFIVIDRDMGRGQWAHIGMFMQTIALLAVERGYGTCMQEAWGVVRKTMHEHLQLEPHEMLYCGMALGRPDPGAHVNQLETERAGTEQFAQFRGFV